MSNLNFNQFKENLKKVRRVQGLTSIELSSLCELRQKKRIADIEDGRGKPNLDELYSICKVLSVSIDDMINLNVKVEFKFERV